MSSKKYSSILDISLNVCELMGQIAHWGVTFKILLEIDIPTFKEFHQKKKFLGNLPPIKNRFWDATGPPSQGSAQNEFM